MKRMLLLMAMFVGCQALACEVCYGNPNSPQVQGMNMAILFLLVIITLVLMAIASFIAVLWYRANRQSVAYRYLSEG